MTPDEIIRLRQELPCTMPFNYYTDRESAWLLQALLPEAAPVRALRQGAERDAALIESALAPLLRRTDAASRGRAGEIAPELARRLDEMRGVYLRAALDRLLT